ncbi:MAG TPA: hypothetical protein VKY22_23415 [Bradyrhizobium sp.]|nr:hypothetical protein [Bradyrhizobium sp.]
MAITPSRAIRTIKAKREYVKGSLLKKLFGRDRLDERRPGARWRGAFTPRQAAE